LAVGATGAALAMAAALAAAAGAEPIDRFSFAPFETPGGRKVGYATPASPPRPRPNGGARTPTA
jgi:hypothetical protein